MEIIVPVLVKGRN